MKLALRWNQDARQHVRDAGEIYAGLARLKHGSLPGPVLDLGAHVGAFTITAALAGHFVVAVEADPDNARWLRDNIRDHGVSGRVVVIEAAVAAVPGLVRELRCLGGGQSSLVFGKQLSGIGVTHEVPTVSFESLAAMFASWDMLKCDVEGAEWEFLDCNGTGDTLKHFRYLDLELHPTDNKDFFDGDKTHADVVNMRAWLGSLGFEGPQEPHPLMIRKWRNA